MDLSISIIDCNTCNILTENVNDSKAGRRVYGNSLTIFAFSVNAKLLKIKFTKENVVVQEAKSLHCLLTAPNL